MNTTTQDPTMPQISDQAYIAVRTMQLKSPDEQPFSLNFLIWLQLEYQEEVFRQLSKKDGEMVDTLLMLNTYIDKAESGAMIGQDVEILIDVVGQATRLMSWE